MIGQKQPSVCKTPDLCVIACPYNRVLTEIGESPCDLQISLTDGEDDTIEVVFGDSPVGEESS